MSSDEYIYNRDGLSREEVKAIEERERKLKPLEHKLDWLHKVSEIAYDNEAEITKVRINSKQIKGLWERAYPSSSPGVNVFSTDTSDIEIEF